jgi:hypothetical protein
VRELNRQDLQWALRRCPIPALKLLKEKAGKVFLGGGFVRACVANEPVNDVDLFVGSAAEGREAAVYVQSKADGAKLHETVNAFTVHGGSLQLPVQVIHRWVYATAEELIRSFDFTIAMAGVWWESAAEDQGGWRSVCDDRFYEDLSARRLRYTTPARVEEAGGSLLRVLKFYQKGYRIPLDSLGGVTARLINDTRAFAVLQGKEAGREEQLAKVLTGLLREVDPNIDPAHIAHLPSDAEGEATDHEIEEALKDAQSL